MKALLFVTLGLLAISSAFAGETNGNPVYQPPSSLGDLPGGLSIQAAVKQINASIEDWKNERAQVRGTIKNLCGGLNFWRGIFPHVYPEIRHDPVIDVPDILQSGFSDVKLEPDEEKQLEAIHAHPTTSLLDLLEIEISLDQLAMRVSNQTYASAIETLHKHWGMAARCQEATLRAQRDEEMIDAAEDLVQDYQRYDGASTQVIVDTANGDAQPAPAPTPAPMLP